MASWDGQCDGDSGSRGNTPRAEDDRSMERVIPGMIGEPPTIHEIVYDQSMERFKAHCGFLI